jgi:nucleotide-binding universal stress UspA family protein
MNRIDFVGNAIFIPFFLIGVGMLIDYRAFSDLNTIIVAITMSVIATVGKFIAAWLTQKNFKFSNNERLLIFGLTNAQAAATLAAVLVGYNIILGYDTNNEPIRLLNDSILNGTIIMILVTCTIASFATQKSAGNIAMQSQTEEDSKDNFEKILIPLSNPNNVDELINLSNIIKSKNNKDGLYALNIINSDNSLPDAEKNARKILDKAKIAASATDIDLKILLRYDLNLVNGVTNIIKENSITDLILGLHNKGSLSDTFLGTLTEGILSKSNVSTYIYRPFQPISTIKRHLVIIPENAEYEIGFSFWLAKIWNIAINTGSKIVFFSSEHTIEIIRNICSKHPIEVEYNSFTEWDDFLILSRNIKLDDNIIIVLSRKNLLSYQTSMNKIPEYLNKYFQDQSYLLIYPSQNIRISREQIDLTNPSLLETIAKIDTIGKTIANIFGKIK